MKILMHKYWSKFGQKPGFWSKVGKKVGRKIVENYMEVPIILYGSPYNLSEIPIIFEERSSFGQKPTFITQKVLKIKIIWKSL